MTTTRATPFRTWLIWTPTIDRTYPLGEVAAAIRRLLDGKDRGKLVVSVSPGGIQAPATGSTP